MGVRQRSNETTSVNWEGPRSHAVEKELEAGRSLAAGAQVQGGKVQAWVLKPGPGSVGRGKRALKIGIQSLTHQPCVSLVLNL